MGTPQAVSPERPCPGHGARATLCSDRTQPLLACLCQGGNQEDRGANGSGAFTLRRPVQGPGTS
eukprot:3625950-Alexandrium_andersonii.AAC.1